MLVPRFPVRRLMIVVAIAGLLLGGFVEFQILRRRSDRYRQIAREHAEMGKMLRSLAGQPGMNLLYCAPAPGTRSVAFSIREVIDHQDRLRRKYERAARYPWLALEPDPTLPE